MAMQVATRPPGAPSETPRTPKLLRQMRRHLADALGAADWETHRPNIEHTGGPTPAYAVGWMEDHIQHALALLERAERHAADECSLPERLDILNERLVCVLADAENWVDRMHFIARCDGGATSEQCRAVIRTKRRIAEVWRHVLDEGRSLNGEEAAR